MPGEKGASVLSLQAEMLVTVPVFASTLRWGFVTDVVGGPGGANCCMLTVSGTWPAVPRQPGMLTVTR